MSAHKATAAPANIPPSPARVPGIGHAKLHKGAHDKCYIANSVTTEIAAQARVA